MGTRHAEPASSDASVVGGEGRSSDVEDTMMVAVGEVIDSRYRVERVLGSGAMGMVLLVEHLELKEKRAIKLMHRRSVGDARAVERFVREARASASVMSPFITRVFDLGRLPDGIPFIVMEALDGRDLRDLLERRGAFELDELVGMMLQTLSGLAEAHDKRIVHRDLKPSNLFVVRRAAPDGQRMRSIVKLLDFGIAKMRGVTGEVTTDSDVLGSPLYMAPEQVRSTKDVDARADIWSMGTILYRCLAGRNAFSGDTVADIMVDVLTSEPVPIRTHNPAVPEALDALVLACLSKPARARPQTARELSKALLAAVPADVAERAKTWLDVDVDEDPAPSAAPSTQARSSRRAAGPDSVATARATREADPATLTVPPRPKPEAATARTLDATDTSITPEVEPTLDRTVDRHGADPPQERSQDDLDDPAPYATRTPRRRTFPLIAAAVVSVGALTAYLALRSPPTANDAQAAPTRATQTTTSRADAAPSASTFSPSPSPSPASASSSSSSSSPSPSSSATPQTITRTKPAPAASTSTLGPAEAIATTSPTTPSALPPSDPTRVRK